MRGMCVLSSAISTRSKGVDAKRYENNRSVVWLMRGIEKMMYESCKHGDIVSGKRDRALTGRGHNNHNGI